MTHRFERKPFLPSEWFESRGFDRTETGCYKKTLPSHGGYPTEILIDLGGHAYITQRDNDGGDCCIYLKVRDICDVDSILRAFRDFMQTEY